jgi:glycosyltransferase involved in cell wall biosynthesis
MMIKDFQGDPHPGAPRILFVGWAHSSHTHGWLDLLADAGFNVRLYALPLGFPPDEWPVRTYLTQSTGRRFDPATRVKLYPLNKPDLWLRNRLSRALFGAETDAPRRGLAEVIRRWRPDVVHALGIDPAGLFYAQVRARFGLERHGLWVQHIWGGSDLALTLDDPDKRPGILAVLRSCHALITDTSRNVGLVEQLGVPPEKFSPLTPIPGNGGIDVEALRQSWSGPPSARRDVLWPKAYECPYSKALPVFEALGLCAGELAGRTVHLLAMNDESRAWYNALPEALRSICRPHDRIPHQEALALMARSRVMLAPSLIDGFPNCVHEAMACGAVPVVSPLVNITAHVAAEENVLFARNLYPQEIAEALRRALTDDVLADTMAARNVEVARQVAHRPALAARVQAWYAELAAQARGERVC